MGEVQQGEKFPGGAPGVLGKGVRGKEDPDWAWLLGRRRGASAEEGS